MSKVLAFGGFAVAGAFILDQSCDGGRTLNFFREKLVRFKRWVAGDNRKEEFKAITYVEGNQAILDVEGNVPNSDGAGNQANLDDVVNKLKLE